MSSYLELLSTSRLRPKMVAFFVCSNSPVSTRQLAKYIEEDPGAVGHLVKEFWHAGIIRRVKDGGKIGYILNPDCAVRDELKCLAKSATGKGTEAIKATDPASPTTLGAGSLFL